MSNKALIILRLSWAALFAWFGSQQLLHPTDWIGFLPESLGYIPVPSEMIVQINGWVEIIGALLLLTGTYVKPVALVLAAHLFGIAAIAGGAIGVRDAALAMMGVAIALSPTDTWTLDAKK